MCVPLLLFDALQQIKMVSTKKNELNFPAVKKIEFFSHLKEIEKFISEWKHWGINIEKSVKWISDWLLIFTTCAFLFYGCIWNAFLVFHVWHSTKKFLYFYSSFQIHSINNSRVKWKFIDEKLDINQSNFIQLNK